MQIYGTWRWIGNEILPEKFRTGKFPVEVTMEDIVELSAKYDIAFFVLRTGQNCFWPLMNLVESFVQDERKKP